MPNIPAVLLCLYHHDALDRLAGRLLVGQNGRHCFYQNNQLTTETQGQSQRCWLQTPRQLLAVQQGAAGVTQVALPGTDTQGSVLLGLDASQRQSYVYSVYGTRNPAFDSLHLPGFNGEPADPVTGHYLLGNGYRAFNPVLMRFNSPDSESPFGEGGFNSYAYCRGDPVNKVDPDGRVANPWKGMLNKLKLRTPGKTRLFEHQKAMRLERELTMARERRATWVVARAQRQEEQVLRELRHGRETMPSGLLLDKSKRGSFASNAQYEAELLEVGGLNELNNDRYWRLVSEADEQTKIIYQSKILLQRIETRIANEKWGRIRAYGPKTTRLRWADTVVSPGTRRRNSADYMRK